MKEKDMLEILQQDIEIPDIVQLKAADTFRKIQMQAAAGRQSAAPGHPVSSRKHFPKKRTVLIAAAAVLGLATVSAAAWMNWSKSLSEGMQVSPEQQSELEEHNITSFLEQSCTDAGITVTAVQSITDNYFTHIIFRVEGYALTEGSQPDFEQTVVQVNGNPHTSRSCTFYDGIILGNDGMPCYADGSPLETYENGQTKHRYVQEDGSLEYWMTLQNSTANESFLNQPVHIELKNLGTVQKAAFSPDVEGTWTFDWILTDSDSRKVCQTDTPLGESGAVVKKVEISPLSLLAEYEVPREISEPPMLRGVVLKDGTLLPNLFRGPGRSGYTDDDSSIYQIAFAIDRILDVGQVRGILFTRSAPESGELPSIENFYEVPVA